MKNSIPNLGDLLAAKEEAARVQGREKPLNPSNQVAREQAYHFLCLVGRSLVDQKPFTFSAYLVFE